MPSTRDRILATQAAQGWTDETLLGLLIDAIETQTYSSQDDILCYLQGVVDGDNEACE